MTAQEHDIKQFKDDIRNCRAAAVSRTLARWPALARVTLPPGDDPWAVNGWTPLHLAAWFGQKEIARALLDAGADIDAVDSGGRVALHNAIEAGGRGVTDLLIERGAHMDVCAAAILGRTERLESLLRDNPALASDDSTGLTALGWAAFGNRAEAAALLLEHGADRRDVGALFCAASVNGARFLAFMFEHGADPGARQQGRTLLHEAVAMRYSSDSSATVELLLARGADPSRRDDAGRTPLEQACQARQLADSASPGATAEESKRFDRLIEILSRADLGAGPVTDEDSA